MASIGGAALSVAAISRRAVARSTSLLINASSRQLPGHADSHCGQPVCTAAESRRGFDPASPARRSALQVGLGTLERRRVGDRELEINAAPALSSRRHARGTASSEAFIRSRSAAPCSTGTARSARRARSRYAARRGLRRRRSSAFLRATSTAPAQACEKRRRSINCAISPVDVLIARRRGAANTVDEQWFVDRAHVGLRADHAPARRP